jgi:hypothetical protein
MPGDSCRCSPPHASAQAQAPPTAALQTLDRILESYAGPDVAPVSARLPNVLNDATAPLSRVGAICAQLTQATLSGAADSSQIAPATKSKVFDNYRR